VSMPKRSMWRIAQFDTLRLRLIKIAARVVEMKTMIQVHLPTSCPAQDVLRGSGELERTILSDQGLRHLGDASQIPFRVREVSLGIA
jgi:hypothetical protein